MPGPFDSIARSLIDLFKEDYSEYYHLGASHPETGENLFVGLHADGKGATVLSEADIPDNVTVESDWSSYVEGAGLAVNSALQDAAGEVFAASNQFVGQSPELTTAIQNIDLNNTNYIDLYHIDHAAEVIGKAAAEKAFMTSDAEANGVYSSIANDMTSVRDIMQTIKDSPEASTLLGVDKDLQDIGLDSAEIEAVMSVPENVNAPAPETAPVPDMQQFP